MTFYRHLFKRLQHDENLAWSAQQLLVGYHYHLLSKYILMTAKIVVVWDLIISLYQDFRLQRRTFLKNPRIDTRDEKRGQRPECQAM